MRNKPNRIYELRKEAGLSQEQLGDELGCNKSKISKLENGNQELTQNWMNKIANALNKQGLTITSSDILPPEENFLDKEEKDIVESLRTLAEPERKEFDAMFKLIKKKTNS